MTAEKLVASLNEARELVPDASTLRDLMAKLSGRVLAALETCPEDADGWHDHMCDVETVADLFSVLECNHVGLDYIAASIPRRLAEESEF